jgi:hypothetical protein
VTGKGRGRARCGCAFGEAERCATVHEISAGLLTTRVDIFHASGEWARTVYVHASEYREDEGS